MTPIYSGTNGGAVIVGLSIMIPVETNAMFVIKKHQLVKNMHLFRNNELHYDRHFQDLDVYVDNEESSLFASKLLNDFEIKHLFKNLGKHDSIFVGGGCLSVRRSLEIFDIMFNVEKVKELIKMIQEIHKALEFYEKR